MENYIKDFDPEFNNMSDGEKLYADALAHLLDKDTADYAEFLNEDTGDALNTAAETDVAYSED